MSPKTPTEKTKKDQQLPVENNLECGTICLIGGEPENIALFETVLSENCYKTISSTDHNCCFEIIEQHCPDVILLDTIISSEIDGYELCRKFKENENTHDIPVVFISSKDHTVDKVRAFRVGGMDYISAPFQTEEVLARIKTQTVQHQIHKQQAIQYEELQKEIQRRRKIEKKLEQLNKQLERIVTIDPLSGLINRRHFMEHYEQEWRRMVRERKPLGLILCDIDNFEEFNRIHSTRAGDLILQKTANSIRKTARRPGDIVARWGEDEFILLLPGTDQKGTQTLAENISKNQIGLKDGEDSKSITLTIGLSSIVPIIGIPPENLLTKTSEALLLAKKTSSRIYSL